MKQITEKTFVKLHYRIYYWRDFPLWASDKNPYYHNDISIIRTPEFEAFYKKALMDCIIKDWNVKRIDDFIYKFDYMWNTYDYLVMAEHFYSEKAKAPKVNFTDLLK